MMSLNLIGDFQIPSISTSRVVIKQVTATTNVEIMNRLNRPIQN